MNVKTTITLSAELAKKAKAYCHKNGMTVSGLVKVLLAQFLADKEI